ncbi:MAG: hypothetical protein ACYDCL_08525 [Myxococcales bacterium]
MRTTFVTMALVLVHSACGAGAPPVGPCGSSADACAGPADCCTGFACVDGRCSFTGEGDGAGTAASASAPAPRDSGPSAEPGRAAPSAGAGPSLDAGAAPGAGSSPDAGLAADAGSSEPGVPGEGTLCSYPGGTCPDPLACATWCPYQNPTGVCRIPCDSGCPGGESCGGDGTCQCVPALEPGGAGDSCAGVGLVCNPRLLVCQASQPQADCPSQAPYSALWQLCLPSGC